MPIAENQDLLLINSAIDMVAEDALRERRATQEREFALSEALRKENVEKERTRAANIFGLFKEAALSRNLTPESRGKFQDAAIRAAEGEHFDPSTAPQMQFSETGGKTFPDAVRFYQQNFENLTPQDLQQAFQKGFIERTDLKRKTTEGQRTAATKTGTKNRDERQKVLNRLSTEAVTLHKSGRRNAAGLIAGVPASEVTGYIERLNTLIKRNASGKWSPEDQAEFDQLENIVTVLLNRERAGAEDAATSAGMGEVKKLLQDALKE